MKIKYIVFILYLSSLLVLLAAQAEEPQFSSEPYYHFDTDIPPLPKRYTNNWGMEFVLIPAGVFQMGIPKREPLYNSDSPPHWVQIAQPFYMQSKEVTQGQWEAVMKHSQKPTLNMLYRFAVSQLEGDARIDETANMFAGPKGANYPIYYVLWYDTQLFIRYLQSDLYSDQPYLQYRLPTEAEWEYASRTGKESIYWWGNDPEPRHKWANCSGDSDGYKGLAPVGSFPPNPWGLYDMVGNASEWVQNAHYYPYPEQTSKNNPVRDPLEAIDGYGSTKSYSGIEITYEKDLVYPCRTSVGNRPENHSNSGLGFRLMLSASSVMTQLGMEAHEEEHQSWYKRQVKRNGG